MSQSRFAKTLARGAVVLWREQPTQYDIEALRANIERVGLVIRVRWAIVAVLAGFSVIAAAIFGLLDDPDILAKNMGIPAFALAFVLLYNLLYQMTYRRVGNIAYLNQAQLLFDSIVATVLVYYSGGVYSWFSSMYLLFILESAFILNRRRDVWLLVAACTLQYGIIVFGEYLGWFPHVNLPFATNELYADLSYVLVRFMWKATLFGGTALVGMVMTRAIRKRERELRESSFIDELTGLFNRQYFYRVLSSEAERARRDERDLALVLADIDNFGDVNRTFGVDVGDQVLSAIATHLRAVADTSPVSGASHVNVACRFGGEELALIVPDVAHREGDHLPGADRALAIAEAFRRAVESTRVSGVSVTVSVGVAVAPRDGETPDALIDAADAMLSLAAAEGGNAVRASWLTDGQPSTDA